MNLPRLTGSRYDIGDHRNRVSRERGTELVRSPDEGAPLAFEQFTQGAVHRFPLQPRLPPQFRDFFLRHQRLQLRAVEKIEENGESLTEGQVALLPCRQVHRLELRCQ